MWCGGGWGKGGVFFQVMFGVESVLSSPLFHFLLGLRTSGLSMQAFFFLVGQVLSLKLLVNIF